MNATTIPKVADVEQRIDLYGFDWSRYATISDAMGESSPVRLIYLDGRMTFLTRSRRHEWSVLCLEHLVAAIASGLDLACEPAGETTFRLEGSDAGAEGDVTFYLGANAEKMRGPRDVDLSVDPPPDLAIEVEVSHSADAAMGVWRRLGVPEVWRLNAVAETLSFWVRGDDGSYATADRSLGFPTVEPSDVLGQLHLAEELGFSRWHARLADWVRTILAERGL